MIQFYSQHGEDEFCYKLLDECTNGFFVDVGALDGKHLSNTFAFELLGWKGICIEPHNFFFDFCKKNRPNSICINAAISDYNKDNVNFATNYYGTLSTLQPEKYEKVFSTRFKTRFKGFTNQKVKVRTLDTIFTNNNVKNIDILSIDVEGEELKVLHGLDIKKYQPKIIIIEAFDQQKIDDITNLMDYNNYFLSTKINANLIFVYTNEYLIKAKRISINSRKLNHTGNPRD
jgi:FkbM family methyltransferase